MNERTTEKQLESLFSDDERQETYYACDDKRCRVQVCQNQNCMRNVPGSSMHRFHRDLNSGINMLRVFAYSLQYQNHCLRHPAYCKSLGEEREKRRKISQALAKRSEGESDDESESSDDEYDLDEDEEEDADEVE